MLDQNSLRLGNLLRHGNTRQFLEVVSLSSTGIRVAEFRTKILVDCQPEPIPLTPEILAAAGFVNVSTELIEKYRFEDWLTLQIWSEGKYVLQNFPPKVKLVTHLHQLQNVVHALTGQELTINLPQTA
jgi:hypothetical protein